MEKNIGPYQILKELGKGGTSTCYLATKPPLEHEILLKVLYPQFSADPKVFSRFEREARLMSRLKHPGILQVIDFGKLENTHFIAAEFIEGKLFDQVIAEQRLDPDKITHIMMQLVEALSYVHQRGIVHRDIKPSNILLPQEGSPKLTDFGLAWAKSLTGITEEGTFLGTPAYMSLEQLKGDKIGVGTDIYSLGLVFMEALTRTKAYTGKNYGEVIQNILTKSPDGVKQLASCVSPELVRIIEKMIQKEQKERYQSADDVLRDLKGFCGEPAPRKTRPRLTYVSWLIAALFLAVVGWNMKGMYSLRRVPQPADSLSIGEILPGQTDSKQESENEETATEVMIMGESTEQSTLPISLAGNVQFPLYIRVLPYAEIYLNDTLIGETPPAIQTRVKQGKHTLLLKNPRFPNVVKQLNIQDEQEISVNLLEEVAYLLVSVKPWAEIWVDGTHRGTTPLGKPLILPAGEHEVTLHNPHFEDSVRTLDLQKGDTLRLVLTFEK
jgi:serine/threonine-protein kinase